MQFHTVILTVYHFRGLRCAIREEGIAKYLSVSKYRFAEGREPKGTGRVIARDASDEFKKWSFVDACLEREAAKGQMYNQEETTKCTFLRHYPTDRMPNR